MTHAYRLEGSAAYLSAGSGVEVCIDATDLPLVLHHRWYSVRNNNSKNHERRYVLAQINGRTVYLHRLLLDAPPGTPVDHINHDTLDNRRANLRLITTQKNNMNRDGAYSTSATKVRGVSTHKATGDKRYYVFRCHGRDCRTAKYFPHNEEGFAAACAYAAEHYEKALSA